MLRVRNGFVAPVECRAQAFEIILQVRGINRFGQARRSHERRIGFLNCAQAFVAQVHVFERLKNVLVRKLAAQQQRVVKLVGFIGEIVGMPVMQQCQRFADNGAYLLVGNPLGVLVSVAGKVRDACIHRPAATTEA